MSFSAAAADERVLDVAFSDDALSVSLRDGRVISVPLVWYPRLLNATPAQRKNWKIAGGGYGIHWPDLDEDLSTEGLLRGAPAPKALRLAPEAIRRLSKLERPLLPLIVQGLTTPDIAAELGISEEAVRSRVQRIVRKLWAHSRPETPPLLPLRKQALKNRSAG
ncbi:MAG: DUF2442 domain-containing protein [Candidatus Sulfotelmatobacter sp.]